MKTLPLLAILPVIVGGTPPAAHAQTTVGLALAVDGDVGIPVDRSVLSAGAGFDGRVGLRIAVPRRRKDRVVGTFAFTPELATGVMFMGGRVFRVRPGIRMGFGGVVAPSLYTHLGFGTTRYYSHPTFGWDGAPIPGHYATLDGLALDAGLALDVHPIELCSVGAHVGYNVANAGDPAQEDTASFVSKWVSVGVQVSFYF